MGVWGVSGKIRRLIPLVAQINDDVIFVLGGPVGGGYCGCVGYCENPTSRHHSHLLVCLVYLQISFCNSFDEAGNQIKRKAKKQTKIFFSGTFRFRGRRATASPPPQERRGLTPTPTRPSYPALGPADLPGAAAPGLRPHAGPSADPRHRRRRRGGAAPPEGHPDRGRSLSRHCAAD